MIVGMDSVNNSMTQTEYIKIKNEIFKLQSEQNFDDVDNSEEIKILKQQIEEALASTLFELLNQYVEKFNDNFPIMCVRDMDESEIIYSIEKCIRDDTLYNLNLNDTVDY